MEVRGRNVVFKYIFKGKRCCSSIPISDSEDDVDNLSQQEKSSQVFSPCNDAAVPRKNKKKQDGTASSVLMNYILNNRTTEDTNNKNENSDDIDLFFKSMAVMTKKLSEYNQAIVKSRVFNVISQLEIEELSSHRNNQHPPPHTPHPSLSRTFTPPRASTPPMYTSLQPLHPTNFYSNFST